METDKQMENDDKRVFKKKNNLNFNLFFFIPIAKRGPISK